ncbi:MAG: HD domain-containing protein [Leptolyngbyaceae cyanobacterium RU_5_1]|nr:HD domain-containing protein [Leptolyngbyaceae cyanobacterium RU_5_1]
MCDPRNSLSVPHPSTNQFSAKEHSALTPYRRQSVLSWLNENVPGKRLKHILRVEEMAIALARLYCLDVERAAQAGLMHDLAKFFNPKQLLQMAKEERLELDSVDVANPHLLHAEVGAIVAREEFGIQDQHVLDAIRNHTLGRPGMSPLSCVVYLADSLEPGRGDTPELAELRQTSRQDLYRAVWLTSEYTLKFLLATPNLIHPRTILTRNWAMQMAIQTGKAYKQ